MKLVLNGHQEIYAVEQTMMALLPEEKPVYGSITAEDTRWAIVSLREDGNVCTAETELGWDGKNGSNIQSSTLTGTDYEKEGQRRKLLELSFFHAATAATGITPPWGSLNGVRPDKVAVRAFDEGKTEEETNTLLRDIYSVTAPRRQLALETAQETIRTRQMLGPKDICVYIGIPFCPTRCAYCSFVSASVEKTFALVEPYLDALIQELKSGSELVQRLGLRVRTFYMGGGTPTTLTAKQMDRLLTAFEQNFDLTACEEYTVEAGRPDTVTPEKLSVLKAHGIGRVSINPQSMDDKVLQAIGRRHSAEEIVRAMADVRQAQFDHVNMDLIAGLPKDTPAGFRRSLDEVLEFGADNITIHTLSLKKGSRILLEQSAIPTADEVGEMLDYANPKLRNAGYVPYYLYRQKYMSGSFENVGWCRPGSQNLYNICIMSELCSILSFGAGGSTKMVDPNTGKISRVFNLKYPKEYTERPEKTRTNQAAFAACYAKNSC